MNKKSRKALEQKVTDAILGQLSLHGKSTAVEMKKHIKKNGKALVKKFEKSLLKAGKKKKAAVEKKKSGSKKKSTKK